MLCIKASVPADTGEGRKGMERKDWGHEINKLEHDNGYHNVWIFPDENGLHCASALNHKGIRVSIGCGCKGRIKLYKEVKEYFN